MRSRVAPPCWWSRCSRAGRARSLRRRFRRRRSPQVAGGEPIFEGHLLRRRRRAPDADEMADRRVDRHWIALRLGSGDHDASPECARGWRLRAGGRAARAPAELGLSAEGFADDEVHKWLAANRYLKGIFSGDDVEHPMLMKWLIAASIGIGSHFGWAAETMTRLPNALAGGASVLVVALLARRLFGRTAALISAALTACSVTLIGYQRVAKEDTLLGLFLMLLLWCIAEAKAAADDGRDPRRWELYAAASLAGMLASKYF